MRRPLCRARVRFPVATEAIYGILDGFLSPNRMAYAIIKTGGRQFRVAEGDTIDVDLLDVDQGKPDLRDVRCLRRKE